MVVPAVIEFFAPQPARKIRQIVAVLQISDIPRRSVTSWLPMKFGKLHPVI
jgi:hypothetical protein